MHQAREGLLDQAEESPVFLPVQTIAPAVAATAQSFLLLKLLRSLNGQARRLAPAS
jgi:hypothetical protein